jgi:16S rRNA processing protein RimM
LLGRIVGAHGIKGDVVVHSFAAVPEDIAAYGPLTDKAGTRSFKLRVLRLTPKGALIVRIAGVSERNAAEALKGVELHVAREMLPDPEADEFYHADLVGLQAVAPDGAAIGEVVAVQNYGAGDLLDIRIPGRRETELVPFSDKFVPEVDVAAGKVVVVMPTAAPDDEDNGA